MSEIEPMIENVQPGDVVTLEKGAPGEPGHRLATGKWTAGFIQHNVDNGWYLTRIARPAPAIPTKRGERFWARYEFGGNVEEFVVTHRDRETLFVSLHDGMSWAPVEHDESFTVVPAPEPDMVLDAVSVPADLIQEVEDWWCSLDGGERGDRRAAAILARVARAVVEERDGEADGR